MTKSYRELMRLETFEERFAYLKLTGQVGGATFGSERYMNQFLYTSQKWQRTRKKVIMRDDCCDLGIEGRLIISRPTVHHINPISLEDIENDRDCLYDLDNLITSHVLTHKAIHFGSERLLQKEHKPRSSGDTTLWARRR